MTSLPRGFAVRLSPSVKVRDRGLTLVGGAPVRVSYLGVRARELLSDGILRTVDDVSTRLAEQLLSSGIAEPVTSLIPEMSLDQVTCVVPVRDRADSLERLLSGLGRALRVVVVDDASRDLRPVMEVTSRHGAELLPLSRHVGPAGARNAGLRMVATPYVLFADSDVVIDVEEVRRILKHFHDPKVAAIAPRIRSLNPGKSWISKYEAACSSLDRGPASASVRPGSAVGWVPSALLAARVEAIGEGFDPSMHVGEDVDFVWRLVDDGWVVRYDAGISARHDHRTSLVPWLRRKVFYGTSADALARRHGSKVAPAVLTPTGVAIAAAALAQRRWSLPVIGALYGVLTIRLSHRLGRSENPRRLAAELAAQGVSSSLAQLTGLLLRHWWPVGAVGATVSPRIRRAVAVCVLVETASEYRRRRPEMGVAAFALATRMDSAAYGTGLWMGAVRQRSLRALLPHITAPHKR